ncbi:MAG: beta-ketoacyl synthase N-terminal-like domain-containing protein, partial [Adhaeribacter sp.]
GSIIKVLAAFRERVLPPSPQAYPLNALLSETRFTVSEAPQAWESPGNRVAGISNFGFGGNNAHVILEEWDPQSSYPVRQEGAVPAQVAIVGLELQSEQFPDAQAYLNRLLGLPAGQEVREELAFDVGKLSSPPSDLKYALSQQLLMLHTTQRLLAKGIRLSPEKTGVFIGFGADAEVNRHGFRKRLKTLLEVGEVPVGDYDLEELEEVIGPALNAAGVLGTMPNMPANRLNHHFGLSGMGFTVSAEERSGLKALDIAIQAIRNQELDSALVGAVDVSREPVHQAALQQVLGLDGPTTDLALVLALKNYDQALQDGDTILACLGPEEAKQDTFVLDRGWVLGQLGYSHACVGLAEVATAVLLTRHRLQLSPGGDSLYPILESGGGFAYTVTGTSLFGGANRFQVCSVPLPQVQGRTSGLLSLHCYAAEDAGALLDAIRRNSSSGTGPHRLGIVCRQEELAVMCRQATDLLEASPERRGWLTDRIHYCSKQIGGELAFVFTGAASAYPCMGRELLQEFPGLVASLQPCCSEPAFAGDWIYQDPEEKSRLPFYQLAGSSLLCQLHASFTQNILGIRPQAAIGLSSGETNAMYALGVWEDMDALLQEIYRSGLYQSALGVEFDAVKAYWQLPEGEKVHWENWRILAPLQEVQALLEKEERAYLTIVNTDTDCVIGGEGQACARILQAIGTHRAMPLQHDIAVHCAPVQAFEKTWRQLHTRKVNPVTGIRFYSNYLDGVYQPTSESVAEALTGQALHPIHFPKIIRKAWAEGVRVFVEHGPRNSLSTAIREILQDKEYVAVSLDRFGRSGLVEALRAATELWAAGVAVDLEALTDRPNPGTQAPKAWVRFPLHLPEIKLALPFTIPMPENNSPVQVPARVADAPERAPQLAVTKRSRREAPAAAPAPETPPFSLPLNPVPEAEVNLIPREAAAEYLPQAAAFASGEEGNPVLYLIRHQHALMRQAHDHYLLTQWQGQQAYAGHLQHQVAGLLEAGQQAMAFSAPAAPVYHLPPQAEPAAMSARLRENQDPAQNRQEAGPAPAPRQEEPGVVPGLPPDSPAISLVSPAALPASPQGQPPVLPGPKFSRQQLEVLSSGKISSVFGSLFLQQDQYAIQVRMPEPPLLLCDRVTGIRGEAGTLGLGTIWTETDVTDTSWYLHNNRMPPGIFIEAGQADLLLISYLGIDFQNKGERAYRLLGCELTFYDELPKPGETLQYDIHVDGYAKSGDTTLFFFHYDCHINGKLRISVRSGQAGFFTKQELAESKGVIWDPAAAVYGPGHAPGRELATRKNAFGPAEIDAYTSGDMTGCFGPELAWTQTHTRTPRSQGGYQNFIKDVTAFDLQGGPAGRGYLRSETIVNPDDWYFQGHFKNDPCMPGTLMADACLQMMAFYLVGAGFTTTRDGWRFEPLTQEKYKFVCRGQVTPESRKVTYEIFVDRLVDGEYPTLYAHVLTTVDGNKAFLCEGLALRLVPDWPLGTMRHLVAAEVPGKAVASYKGFKFGYESLINCALGRPADAFGPDFAHYDSGVRSPRLPGPPYHFMTRIADYRVVPGEYGNEPYVVAEYDLPREAWYFGDNGSATMPYGVLMEVALQPCGWFSTFLCQHEIKGKDLLFRNLDGKAVQHRSVVPGDETIVTKTVLSGVSIMGEIIIVKFAVTSTIAGEPVFTMNTVFGFFDTDSMKTQKGLAISEQERANLSLAPNLQVKLAAFPESYFGHHSARLPASKLLMLDRLVSFYPEGGRHGRGSLKAEKEVNIGEWFFKAHFFQDPVQPGSLGIEAMVQLMQFYMLHQGFQHRFQAPVFEPIALGEETEWHYRGQVTPDKKLITVDFEVKEVVEETGAVRVMGEARLWADGLKIYHAPSIGMRLAERKEKEQAG